MKNRTQSLADRYVEENVCTFAAIAKGHYMAARKHELRARHCILKARRTPEGAEKGDFGGTIARIDERIVALGGLPDVKPYNRWLEERGTDFAFFPEEEETGNVAAHVRYRALRLQGRAFMKLLGLDHG